MNFDQKLNRDDLDRLVDGLLDGEEYQKVIQQIDSTPGAWKQCALVFLESQALSKDFSSLFSSPQKSEPHQTESIHPPQINSDSIFKSVQAVSSKSISTIATSAGGSDSSKSNLIPKFQKKTNWFERTGGWMFVATAASVLIAFGLGVYSNGLLERSESSPDVGGLVSSGESQLNSVTLPLLLRDQQSGKEHEFDVPVSSGENVVSSVTGRLPVEMDEVLKSGEYEVTRNLVPIRHTNGKVYSVPIDQYRFKNSKKRYQ